MSPPEATQTQTQVNHYNELSSELETSTDDDLTVAESQGPITVESSQCLFKTQSTPSFVYSRKRSLEDEIKKYKNLPRDTLRNFALKAKLPFTFRKYCPFGDLVEVWWESNRQEFPILTDLALRILNAPSSSSIIERTFGKISRYVTKQRNSLKAKTLEAFVKFDEFEKFETSAAFLLKKHGETYENMVWTADDLDSVSPEYDYLGGLIEG